MAEANPTFPPQTTRDSLSAEVMIEGSPAADWWEGQSQDTMDRFVAAVRAGVLNGDPNEKITANVVDMLGVARRNARALVHTAIMTAANDARMETFKDMADVLLGFQWLATLDSSTCLECMALDGQTWNFDNQPIGKANLEFPDSCPLHFNCRCVLSPLVDLFAGDVPGLVGADKTRASDIGPISGDTSMQAYLSRLTPEQLADRLGPGRAQLFLDGKITVRDLVDKSGNEMTLEELRNKFAPPEIPELGQLIDEASSRDQAAAQVLRWGQINGREQAVLLDGQTQQEIWRINGEALHVEFDPQSLTDLNGNILVHNHPTYDSAFSYGDLNTAQRYGLAEIVAVGNQGTEFVSSNVQPFSDELYSDVFETAHNFDAETINGGISNADINAIVLHAVNTALADEGKMIYWTRNESAYFKAVIARNQSLFDRMVAAMRETIRGF
jgi:SPP1 gp7 family putative phage head morphogenesis protein